MKLLSKYSNLCDHDTSTLQTDRRTNGQIAVASHRIARWKYSSSATVHCMRNAHQPKNGGTYKPKHAKKNETHQKKAPEIQKQNRKRKNDQTGGIQTPESIAKCMGITRCADTAIRNFPRWRPAAISWIWCNQKRAILSADPENPT